MSVDWRLEKKREKQEAVVGIGHVTHIDIQAKALSGAAPGAQRIAIRESQVTTIIDTVGTIAAFQITPGDSSRPNRVLVQLA